MCWPMVGRSGTLTVRLASPTRVDAVSIEHYPAAANPHRETAPRAFSLWALATVDDANPAPITPARDVTLSYDVHAGHHVQTFAVQAPAVRLLRGFPSAPRVLDPVPLPRAPLPAHRTRSACCSCAWKTTGARSGTPASTASGYTGRPRRPPPRCSHCLRCGGGSHPIARPPSARPTTAPRATGTGYRCHGMSQSSTSGTAPSHAPAAAATAGSTRACSMRSRNLWRAAADARAAAAGRRGVVGVKRRARRRSVPCVGVSARESAGRARARRRQRRTAAGAHSGARRPNGPRPQRRAKAPGAQRGSSRAKTFRGRGWRAASEASAASARAGRKQPLTRPAGHPARAGPGQVGMSRGCRG